MGIRKHIPNALTCCNLLCGCLAIMCSHNALGALLFVLMAAFFDFFDGLAARSLKAYSAIGKDLDSLADMVSFGVLPAVTLIGTMQLKGADSWTEVIPLFLAVMSALRLAKFNVDERQSTDFIGVATPTAAMICGSLCYFSLHSTALDSLVGSPWFLPAVAVVLGLLLVSEIPMFGMKVARGHKLMDAKRIVFLCLAAAAVLFVVIAGCNWSLAVLLIFTLYVLENLLLAAVRK